MKRFLFLFSLSFGILDSSFAGERPNVLFIASDDMRPQLGCYGDATVKSPNLDALAKRGMVFQRSYVQQALCSPSRISMLSGRYPATTGIFEIGRTLRTTMPDIVTMPQHFKNNGYHTRSLGKIYHEKKKKDAKKRKKMPGIFICFSSNDDYFRTMKTSQSPDPEASEEVDPLVGINVKTSWYPAARGGWSGGRKRILGPKALEANCYHVMSRTCGGDIFFDDTEKEALRRVLWRVAEFCGVQVLTYCVMGNHFHVLASVPHRESWMARFEGSEGERRLLGHLRSLYSKAYVEQLEAEFREWRRIGNEVAVQKKLESFKRRLCDLSRFVKEVKERFSRWYNKRHERRGTLWMDRFKSVLIEGNVGRRGERETDRVDVVRTMAAYIDLNPVRAGLVRDAADYPWCGYGEAKAGTRKAQRGICRVVEKPVDGWETSQVAEVYAGLLGSSQEPSKEPTSKNKLRHSATSRDKQPRQGLQAQLDKGETLGVAELVRHRVRLFSEAMVLGSKAFVDEVFQIERAKFGPKRKEGARRVSECEGALYTMKRVRRWNG